MPLNAGIPGDIPDNAYNFRCVVPTADASDSIGASLFRSAKLDLLEGDEVEWLRGQGIKTIVDCRSPREYKKARGPKDIDKSYNLRTVKIPRFRSRYHVNEEINVKDDTANECSSRHPGNHYIVNFMTLRFYSALCDRAPWYMVLYSLWFLIKDLWRRDPYLFGFLSFYESRWPGCLLSHYKNFIDRSKTSIVAVLKLLSKPGALPAVITCAYGKDRTGIVVAFILTLMGKSKEYIAWDYSLSEGSLDGRMDNSIDIVRRLKLSEDYLWSRRETILGALEHVEKTYGGVEEYLEQSGFGKEEQQMLLRNIAREQIDG